MTTGADASSWRTLQALWPAAALLTGPLLLFALGLYALPIVFVATWLWAVGVTRDRPGHPSLLFLLGSVYVAIVLAVAFFAALAVSINYRLCGTDQPILAVACAGAAYYRIGLSGCKTPRRAWLFFPVAVAVALMILLGFDSGTPGSGTCGD